MRHAAKGARQHDDEDQGQHGNHNGPNRKASDARSGSLLGRLRDGVGNALPAVGARGLRRDNCLAAVLRHVQRAASSVDDAVVAREILHGIVDVGVHRVHVVLDRVCDVGCEGHVVDGRRHADAEAGQRALRLLEKFLIHIVGRLLLVLVGCELLDVQHLRRVLAQIRIAAVRENCAVVHGGILALVRLVCVFHIGGRHRIVPHVCHDLSRVLRNGDPHPADSFFFRLCVDGTTKHHQAADPQVEYAKATDPQVEYAKATDPKVEYAKATDPQVASRVRKTFACMQ